MNLIQVSFLSLPMLRCACWNIRGLNTLIKQVEVRKLIKENNLSLLVLNETKVKHMNHDKVLRNICSWKSIVNYNSIPNGRVWILWDNKVLQVDEICQRDQFLHARVTLYWRVGSSPGLQMFMLSIKSVRGLIWENRYLPLLKVLMNRGLF